MHAATRPARWVSTARPRTRAAARARRPGGGCRAAGADGRRTPPSTVPGGPHAARFRSNQRAARDVIALLAVGERHQEPAQQERALGLPERTLVGPEAVAVAVLGELRLDRLQRGDRTGVSRRDRAADRRRAAAPHLGAGRWASAASARVSAARVWRCPRRSHRRGKPIARPARRRGRTRRSGAGRRRRSAGCASTRRGRSPRSRRRCRARASVWRSPRPRSRRHASRLRRDDHVPRRSETAAAPRRTRRAGTAC